MSYSLKPTLDRFITQSNDIAATFDSVRTLPTHVPPIPRYGNNRPALEGCAVALVDSWGRFIRDLVMNSARPRVYSATGQRLYSNSRDLSPRKARAELVVKKNRIDAFRFGEPSWHLVRSVSDTVDALALSNGAAIKTALSISQIRTGGGATRPNPVDEMIAARNLIVHRGRNAADKFKPFRLDERAGVAHHLCLPVAGQPRLVTWVSDLQVIARLAAE